MVTLASSLQVCLTMGAYIFFLHFLTNIDNLGQKSINFVIVSKGRLLALLVTLMFYHLYFAPFPHSLEINLLSPFLRIKASCWKMPKVLKYSIKTKLMKTHELKET